MNNAASNEDVYVCTKGITTVNVKNTVEIKTGSYGYLAYGTEKGGYIVALGSDIIGANVPVAGYFLENITTTDENFRVLFNVQSNFEFN